MKKLFLFIPLFALTNPIFSQSNLKTWTETTVQDFSDNQLDELIVTNNSGGEVQLSHPFVKTVNDYNDNGIHRFVAKDSAGNFVKTWVQAGNVFVKKYAADGSEKTKTIRVNVEASDEYTLSKVSMMNDGTFLVIWKISFVWYGQIFINDSIKSGTSFRINEIDNEHSAAVLANNKDHNFLLFYTQKIGTEYKLHSQKRDINGNKVGESTYLNPEDLTNLEISPTAIGDEKGFWVAWEGANGISSWDIDLYLRRFNYDGSPADSAIIVNDDLEKGQGSADLELDTDSRLFVVWIDERDSKPTQINGCLNIYGQMFDKNGNTIGKNLRLNDTLFLFNYEPDIEYINEELRISWLSWDEPNRRYLTYINQWKFDPKFSGEMISSVFDASPLGSSFKKIFWDELYFPAADIKLQIRTVKNLGELNNSDWHGPLGSTDFYTNSAGEDINSIHNGDRYIQYKAIFTSPDGNTSILKSVSINYSPSDTIPPLPPTILTVAPSHSSVILSWQPNNDSDLFGYKLYRGMQSSNYDWDVIIPNETLSYKDTTAITNKKYFYVITALDSSHNESDYSNEVSSMPFGANIYVSTNGSSGGDGSINKPFKTLQQAINVSFFGDTVRVLPGIYSETFTMKNGVSLLGTDAEECKITIPITASDYCVIKGFTISKPLSCNGVSPIITGNIFRGTGSYMASIDLQNASSPHISNNFITECAVGIQLNYECNPLIKNNIINANDIGINVVWYCKPEIINNTIVAKTITAINVVSFDVFTIENNILVTLDEFAFTYRENSYSSVELNYNNFWNSYQAGTQVRPTNLFLDPKFVNMDLQDYLLQSSSPCINAGNPAAAYNDVDGTRNDMGAYGGPDPIQSDLSYQLSKSISVSNLSGYPGDTVSVFISLDNAVGLAKADFIMVADNSILTYLNAVLTNATYNFQLESQIISSSEIKFSLSSVSGSQTALTEILEVKYLVNRSSATGDASPLNLKNVFLFDSNLREIFIRSIANGAFIVNNTNESEHYIYVDSRGSNLGDGSRKKPFNTIMKAIEAAASGDTIFVYGGSYYGSVFMKDGITLVGSGASVTNLFAVGDSLAMIFDNINKAEVSGFTIKGDEHYGGFPILSCYSSSPVLKNNKFESLLFNESVIDFFSNSNVLFENNYVYNASIRVDSSSPIIRNNVFEGSTFGAISLHDCLIPLISNNRLYSKYGAPAVNIQNSNAIVRNNFIYCDVDGIGIDFYNSNNSEVFNNIIKDRSAAGVGIILRNSFNNKIINNSVITKGKGIEEQNSSSTILNNIIINNNNFGLQPSSSSNYDYNDVWNNFVNYNGIDPGINDISFDPLFVDTSKGDYRLSSASSCINAGNPNVIYNDIDGSRNDIGAYGGTYADSSWIYQNGSSLSINSITASSVDTIQITIMGEGVKGIAAIDMALSFDPSVIEVIEANSGSLTKSFSLEKTNSESGSINLSLNSSKGISEENGELIKLQLAINTNQTLSTYLHFDSAAVRAENTCLANILNLKDGQIKITTDVDYNDNKIPVAYFLSQNYPNPFNPSTKIRYEIPIESKVLIKVYDILGREVATLVNDYQKAGRYQVEWNAGNLASGVYFYSIKAGDFYSTKKLILLK